VPVPRRVPKARITPEVDDQTWGLLTDEIDPSDLPETWDGRLTVVFADVLPEPNLRTAWRTYGAEITEAYAQSNPGQRPTCWWRWEAPEKERRVLAEPETLGTDPRAEETAYVESEAAYLRRHDLLLPGEAERLTETDFAPEEDTGLAVCGALRGTEAVSGPTPRSALPGPSCATVTNRIRPCPRRGGRLRAIAAHLRAVDHPHADWFCEVIALAHNGVPLDAGMSAIRRRRSDLAVAG
jgi:hypothetical protein